MTPFLTTKGKLLTSLSRYCHYREEAFTLSSGEVSNYYMDCREALSDPHILDCAAISIAEILSPSVTALGGMTMGADPLAIAVSLGVVTKSTPYRYPWRENLRWFSVRKEAKVYGMKRRIEGFSEPGSKVTVLEDVSTTGKSTIEAIKACQEAGLEVVQAIVLVNRGGVPAIKDFNPRLQVDYVLNFTDIQTASLPRVS